MKIILPCSSRASITVTLCALTVGLLRSGSAAPNPQVPAIEGAERLSSWRTGVAEADASRDPLVIACLGDSNTEGSTYTLALRRMLQASYGNRGQGYLTFNTKRSAVTDFVPVKRRGSWRDYDTSPGGEGPPPAPYFAIDGFWSETEDANAGITVAFPKDEPQRLRVHYRVGPGMGKFSVFSGDWEAQRLNCQAEQPGYAVSAPLTGNSFRIERIEGKVALSGFDTERVVWSSGRDVLPGGAIVHALGNGWGQASHLAPTDESTFRGFLTATEPDLITILFGTNDMHNEGVPRKYRESLSTIVGKLQTAAPGIGILILSAPEATQTTAGLAAEYAQIAREVATEKGCAFWDWRQVVGERSRNWSERGFMADQLHYSATGGQAFAGLLLRALHLDVNDLQHWPSLWPAAAPPSKTATTWKRLPALTLDQIPGALAAQPAYKSFDLDRVAAEVRFGATEKEIVVHARVFDGRAVPTLPHWEEVNFDVYAAAPGSNTVRQIVFQPLSPTGQSRISLHESGQEQPEPPAFPRRVELLPGGGYELVAIVPFEVMGLKQNTSEFLLESAAFTAQGPGATPTFSRLFGGIQPDGGAFRDSSHFANIRVEKP